MHPLIAKELAATHAADLVEAAERGRLVRRHRRDRRGFLKGIVAHLAALRGLVLLV